MTDWIAGLGGWAWFLLAALLIGLEVLAPGTFFLWFGVAAVAVGLVTLLIDWPWQAQFAAFGGLALLSLLVSRVVFARRAAEDEPFLNRRADRLVGRVFVLHDPIEHGTGRVKIEDTLWRVSGPDLPRGTRVKVVRHDAALLVVEEAE